MTDDPIPDGGAEFSPDGEWIYFNSERASTRPGHAQLFRIALDRVVCEQLTDDKRVNWYPHPSPDGKRVAYLSYPKSAKGLGQPENSGAIIRVLEPDSGKRDLVAVYGGPGTLNAPCWSPDGAQLAYVAYPIRG
jgi:Tol biopolymer transport system component